MTSLLEYLKYWGAIEKRKQNFSRTLKYQRKLVISNIKAVIQIFM